MKMNKVKYIQKLLKIYEFLPKNKYEPTYLDICKYSGRRFEDICSRILTFYFHPKKEHGLKMLLLESLFESINMQQEYIDDTVQVNREENAEGKRLDILIKNNDWVIGIENKIWANVYNPLEKYGNRIEQYDKQKDYKIILTLREINNKDELKHIENNGFIILLYTAFFESIKKRIGEYISNGNMKYILYLYDFIQTLENMKGNNIMNKEMDAFFAENIDKLEELLEDFQEYKNKKYQIVIDKIGELKTKINEICSPIKWWIYKNDDLGMYKNKHDIGIETGFIENNNDPIAIFRIQFTSWGTKYWDQYGDQIKKLYPNGELKINGSRTYLNVYDIDGYNEDEIISKLKECYDCIVNLK
jgi:hypothetical protein